MRSFRPSSPPVSEDHRRSGTWPATPGDTRAKVLPLSLRAGGVPRSQKLKDPERAAAREFGAKVLARAFDAAGMGSPSVAASLHLGTDKEADETLSGWKPITPGEIALLAPQPVAFDFLMSLVEECLSRDAIGNPVALYVAVGRLLSVLDLLVSRERVANDTTELRLTGPHVDALRILLCK